MGGGWPGAGEDGNAPSRGTLTHPFVMLDPCQCTVFPDSAAEARPSSPSTATTA